MIRITSLQHLYSSFLIPNPDLKPLKPEFPAPGRKSLPPSLLCLQQQRGFERGRLLLHL